VVVVGMEYLVSLTDVGMQVLPFEDQERPSGRWMTAP
jgi:hypothetical protein